MSEKTPPRSGEPQYDVLFHELDDRGAVVMGPMAGHTWRNDPRRLTFFLARYKFVSKMFSGKKRALEVGCGDGFGMRIVLQTVKSAHGIDFDPLFVQWANEQAKKEGIACDFSVADITQTSPAGKFDCAYSLDVIEHIEPAIEERYLRNIVAALEPGAVCIIGTPNITASAYASPISIEGHVNLKSAETLQASLAPFFEHVFIFSMNDEVVHTGFYAMAHYLMALCVNPRPSKGAL
jgi:2-polyprenyl-3-methyl-5-hydroxy-6-metoxy-1,4-benzoquinol methylase